MRYRTDNGEAGTNAGRPVPWSLQAPSSCCCWLFILPAVPQAFRNCSSGPAIDWGEIARCYSFRRICCVLFFLVFQLRAVTPACCSPTVPGCSHFGFVVLSLFFCFQFENLLSPCLQAHGFFPHHTQPTKGSSEVTLIAVTAFLAFPSSSSLEFPSLFLY